MRTVALASGRLLRSFSNLRVLRGSRSETTKVTKGHEERTIKYAIEVDRRRGIVRCREEIE